MITLENRPPCVTDSKEFDDKLFAHIHLDNRLVGTNLEGDTLFRTSQYVLKMLDYVSKTDCGISPQKKKRIQDVLLAARKAFETLSNFDNEITESGNKLEKIGKERNAKFPTVLELENEYIKPIANNIIKKLEIEGSVLIPGGWAGEPGHAMCYQFVQNKEDGSITFLVFNTGAGIEHHLQQQKTLDRFTPVMAYKIPKQQNKENLEIFLGQLLGARIKPHCENITPNKGPDNEDNRDRAKRWREEEDQWKHERKYNSERLYSEILPQVFYLGAEELNPKQYTNIVTQSQISGTCAMRTLMPVLHNLMKGESFQEFLYQVRLQSLIDYYRIKRDNHELQSPMVQRLLEASLSKLALTTIKYMKRRKKGEAIITEAVGQATLSFLEQIQKDLQAHQKSTLEAKVLQEIATFQKPLDNVAVEPLDRYLMLPIPITEHDLKTKNEVAPKMAVPSITDFEDPLEYIQTIYKVANHNAESGYNELVIHEIEKSLMAFPLNPEEAKIYWSKLKPERAKEAFESLEAIQRIYGKYCYQENPYQFPSQTITAYTCKLVGNLILDQFYQNKFSNGIVQLLPRTFTLGDVESVSLDPRWDKRVRELDALTQDIHQKNRLKRLSEFDKKATDDKAQEEALRIGNRVDFLDLEFLTKYIDSATFSELDSMKKNKNSMDSFDNARINFYDLIQGYQTTNSMKIKTAIEQYKMILEFEKLSFETELISEGRYSFFDNIDTTLGFQVKQTRLCLGMETRSDKDPVPIEKSAYKSMQVFRHKPEPYGQFYSSSISDFLMLAKGREAQRILFSDPSVTVQSRRTPTPLTLADSNPRLVHGLSNASPDLPAHFPTRTLNFIRQCDNECRVVATKDFFESNLELFNDIAFVKEGKETQLLGRDFQTLFLTNIFTPELLNKELDRNPNFSNELIKFIDMGFKYHMQGDEINEGGIFFFQVTYHLQKYLMNHPKKSQFLNAIQWLENQDSRLNDTLILYRKKLKMSPNDENNKIYTELLQVNLLRHTLDANKKISEEVLKNLFFSLLKYSQEKAKTNLNQYFSRELLTACALIQPILKTHFEALGSSQEKFIKSLLHDFLIPDIVPDDNYELAKLSYPTVIIQHQNGRSIFIDLSRGKVENLGKRIGNIPFYCYTPEFKKVFGDGSIKAEISEGLGRTICTFNLTSKENQKDTRPSKSQKQTYRVTYYKNEKNTVIEILHDQKWYRLWNHKKPFTPGEHTLDKDFLWWAEVGQETWQTCYLCTDLKGNHLYHVEPAEKKEEASRTLDKLPQRTPEKTAYQCFETDSLGVKTGRTLVNRFSKAGTGKALYDFFSRFENPEYIEIWQQMEHDQKLSLEIKMPRYGLQWIGKINSDSNRMEFFWKDNPDYRLQFSDSWTIPGFAHMLCMENIKTGENIVLIPDREFFVEESATKEQNKDGEYLKLHFDTANAVSQRILETEQDRQQSAQKSVLDSYTSLLWHQRESHKYRLFNVKSHKAEASSTEDYLYLAYLFLAKHEPLKAMEALKKCHALGGLTGTEEEALLIKRLMTEVPNQDGQPSLAKKRCQGITREPDTIAVRLYAGFLLLEKKTSAFNKPLLKLPEKLGDHVVNSANKKVYETLRQRANSFYNLELNNTLKEAYQAYQRIRGNVSVELQTYHYPQVGRDINLTNI